MKYKWNLNEIKKQNQISKTKIISQTLRQNQKSDMKLKGS